MRLLMWTKIRSFFWRGREPYSTVFWKTQKYLKLGVQQHCCCFTDLQRIQGTPARTHAQPGCTPGGKGTSRMALIYLLVVPGTPARNHAQPRWLQGVKGTSRESLGPQPLTMPSQGALQVAGTSPRAPEIFWLQIPYGLTNYTYPPLVPPWGGREAQKVPFPQTIKLSLFKVLGG